MVRKSGDRATVERTFLNLDCILKALGERVGGEGKKEMFERKIAESFKLDSAILSCGF